jgi:hypothetical protein
VAQVSTLLRDAEEFRLKVAHVKCKEQRACSGPMRLAPHNPNWCACRIRAEREQLEMHRHLKRQHSLFTMRIFAAEAAVFAVLSHHLAAGLMVRL